MDRTLARHVRRLHAGLVAPPFPPPSLLQLLAFRMARTSIRLELTPGYRDWDHYRERGWFEAAYWYPATLGPLKRLAGATFDRLAARSSRPRLAHGAAP